MNHLLGMEEEQFWWKSERMLRNNSHTQPPMRIIKRMDKPCTSLVNSDKTTTDTDESEYITSRMESLTIPRHPSLEWPTYQENGQRKYGPPTWWTGDPPPKGTEVYLSHLHRRVFEDELCPILSKVGTIYTFRLMMDFSGSNRGYGFVQYATREEAIRAINELNNYPIRPGHNMTVEESLDNCRLFMGHIPKDLTESKLMNKLCKYMSGIKHVFVYMAAENKRENRGFCFVEFEDHRSAAMGRRYLLCSGIPEWQGMAVTVEWAIPETEVPLSIMEKVTVIYIRNLMISTSEYRIRQLLESIKVNLELVEKIKKVKDFAFVHFSNRNVAEYALKRLHGIHLDGAKLSVSWAKPPLYRLKDGNFAGAQEFNSVSVKRTRHYSPSSTQGNNSSNDSSSSLSYNSSHISYGSTQGTVSNASTQRNTSGFESFYSYDNTSKCESRSSTLSNCDSYNSMLEGAPLYIQKDKYADKSESYLDSIGSSSQVSPCGVFKDDGYVTEASPALSALCYPFDNYPIPVISSTSSYLALVDCVLQKGVLKNYTSQDYLPKPTAFESNNSLNLYQCDQFEGIHNLNVNPGDLFCIDNHNVMSIEPDMGPNLYNSMKEAALALMKQGPPYTYQMLKAIAEDLKWGTLFHVSLELAGGWMVSQVVYRGRALSSSSAVKKVLGNSTVRWPDDDVFASKEFTSGTRLASDDRFLRKIRLDKDGVTKSLAVVENLCESEQDALNAAAAKFLREYILDPRMWPTTDVLFNP